MPTHAAPAAAAFSDRYSVLEPAPFSNLYSVREPAPFSNRYSVREPAPFSDRYSVRQPAALFAAFRRAKLAWAALALVGGLTLLPPLARAEATAPAPRALFAYLKVKPGNEARLLAEAQAVIASSRAEPGNLLYILQQGVSDPQQFVIYELFRSAADLELHRRSAPVINFLAKVDPLIEPGQFFLVPYDPIGLDPRIAGVSSVPSIRDYR